MIQKLKDFFSDYGTRVIAVAFVLLAFAYLGKAHAAPTFTPADMAIRLNASTALLDLGMGHCTTTKIGDRMWLTAKHCVGSNAKVETEKEYLFPRSVTMAAQTKQTGDRSEDWAIINTATADTSVPALPLGCNDSIYPGLPVAYLGYPAGTDRAFIMGYVSTIREVRFGGNDADWVLDLPVAGGASGSAIVSMDTGNIIGVLTEGVFGGQRSGFFMSAAESVKNLDWCEDENEARDRGEEPDAVYDDSDAPLAGHT